MSDNQNNSIADTVAFKSYVGIIGNIFAMLLFIAPITLMIKLHKNQVDPLKVPFLVMIMNIMNCVLWLAYGILAQDIFLMVCNGVGYSLNLIYLCLYFIYRWRKDFKQALVFCALSVVSALFILVLFAFVFLSKGAAQYSAMIFNIFMYAAPGQKIKEVIKLRDNRLIPLPSSIVGLLCSLSWLTYGILPPLNVFIIIPNGLGVLLSIINIYFYFYYTNSTKRAIELEKKSGVRMKNESSTTVSSAISLPSMKGEKQKNENENQSTEKAQIDSSTNINKFYDKPENEASSDVSEHNKTIDKLKNLDNIPASDIENNHTESVIVHVP